MDKGSVTLRGTVLNTDFKSGKAKSGNDYAFTVVSVLAGVKVYDLTWPSGNDALPTPKEGDTLVVECALDVYAGRLQVDPLKTVPAGGARLAPTGS